MLKMSLSHVATMIVASALMTSASANSVGFTQSQYTAASTVEITLVYDYTEFAMFGGGLDLTYDVAALEFVSYTRAELQPDAQAVASPVGSLVEAGVYREFGVGSFDLLSGMSSSGEIGTFVFNVIGPLDAGATPCGAHLCLTQTGQYFFTSFDGQAVADILLGNGITEASITANPIPIPAAVWLMLSGLGALVGLGRKA